MRLDHVCIAVRSIDSAVVRLRDMLGYSPKTEKVTNSRQKVNVQFFGRRESLDIKLIEPSEAESPLWHFLRRGEGLHHLCFLTTDTCRTLDRLERSGLRVLTRPEPGEAFDGGLIAFGYAGFGLNVELVDTAKRTHAISDPGTP